MKENFRRNLSASTFQHLVNQFFSLLVFYFLSTSLTKDDFGKLNWTLSIFLVVFTLLAGGIDQIIIKKIAEGGEKSKLLSVHLFHVFITGLATFLFLFITCQLFPSPGYMSLLLIIGLGKMFLFFSTPFKAVSSGAENFRYVLIMSITSTIAKCCLLGYLLFINKLNLLNTAFIFLIADGTEFVIGALVVRKKLGIPLRLQFHPKNYLSLLKEALPQVGVVLFSSALARIDWLLIGVFLTSSKVAEYSFAYKGFEVASLPLLAIAPYCFRLSQEYWFNKKR
jgi:O-antigen/teichoic acid export membrane protein